jgi:hypothetical protein
LGAKKTGDISRRDFIKRVGMVGFASGLGLNIILPARTYPAGKNLLFSNGLKQIPNLIGGSPISVTRGVSKTGPRSTCISLPNEPFGTRRSPS